MDPWGVPWGEDPCGGSLGWEGSLGGSLGGIPPGGSLRGISWGDLLGEPSRGGPCGPENKFPVYTSPDTSLRWSTNPHQTVPCENLPPSPTVLSLTVQDPSPPDVVTMPNKIAHERDGVCPLWGWRWGGIGFPGMILGGIPGWGSLGKIPLAKPLGGIPGGYMREITGGASLGRSLGRSLGGIPGRIPGGDPWGRSPWGDSWGLL